MRCLFKIPHITWRLKLPHIFNLQLLMRILCFSFSVKVMFRSFKNHHLFSKIVQFCLNVVNHNIKYCLKLKISFSRTQNFAIKFIITHEYSSCAYNIHITCMLHTCRKDIVSRISSASLALGFNFWGGGHFWKKK